MFSDGAIQTASCAPVGCECDWLGGTDEGIDLIRAGEAFRRGTPRIPIHSSKHVSHPCHDIISYNMI